MFKSRKCGHISFLLENLRLTSCCKIFAKNYLDQFIFRHKSDNTFIARLLLDDMNHENDFVQSAVKNSFPIIKSTRYVLELPFMSTHFYFFWNMTVTYSLLHIWNSNLLILVICTYPFLGFSAEFFAKAFSIVPDFQFLALIKTTVSGCELCFMNQNLILAFFNRICR